MEFCCDSTLKDYLTCEVIERCKKYPVLKNLTKNYSAEGGFDLPWSDEWYDMDFNNKDIAIKYHNARQLRFKELNLQCREYGNIITGLRFKDNCNYWSNEELETLNELILTILLK